MKDFLERHRIVARVILLWAMINIQLIILDYREKMGEITGSDATVIVGIVGLFATALGFLQWVRERVEK